jgi:RHS repeat-associated protein
VLEGIHELQPRGRRRPASPFVARADRPPQRTPSRTELRLAAPLIPGRRHGRRRGAPPLSGTRLALRARTARPARASARSLHACADVTLARLHGSRARKRGIQGRNAQQQTLYEEYAPYGTSAYRSAKSGVEVSARRYRYTGKERDDETGLYYHGARYYAAWLARWTSADPLGLQAGLNLYLYGRASPVVYVDPSGMFDVMAMANLGQTVATNAAFSAADAEARSWAPASSDSSQRRHEPTHDGVRPRAGRCRDGGGAIAFRADGVHRTREHGLRDAPRLPGRTLRTSAARRGEHLAAGGAGAQGLHGGGSPRSQALDPERSDRRDGSGARTGTSSCRSARATWRCSSRWAALGRLLERHFRGSGVVVSLARRVPRVQAASGPAAQTLQGVAARWSRSTGLLVFAGVGGGGWHRKPTQEISTIRTDLVRFTQSSANQRLRTGENINDVIGALQGPGGEALAKGFEPIRIFEQNGRLHTLDNRRLLIFSQAGRDVPFVWATPEQVAEESWKFTATTEQAGGWFIRVR